MPGSPSVVAWSGYTVACFGPSGWMATGRQGLYDFDTRLLSQYRLTVDGREPELVTSAQPASERWQAAYRLRREGGTAAGPVLPQDALGLLVSRAVGAGMVDGITIRNHSGAAWESRLTLAFEAEFEGIAEVEARREQAGRIARSWDPAERSLVFRYAVVAAGRELERALRVRVIAANGEARVHDDGLEFELRLEPGAEWALTLGFEPWLNGRWRTPTLDEEARSRQRIAWHRRQPRIEAAEPLPAMFDRAALDLFDLRNFELERQYMPQAPGLGLGSQRRRPDVHRILRPGHADVGLAVGPRRAAGGRGRARGRGRDAGGARRSVARRRAGQDDP